ncbi:MAG: SigE family RNA polymerase sigma factor [Candidatus Nanopelagicales bacterium]
MDDDEFAAWMARTVPGLRGTAYLLTGDWHSADDAVQDTLVRVYQRRWRVQPDAMTAYARRVLTTRVVDAARRPWRREVPVAEPPDRAADATAEVHLDVVAALGALPPGQRAVLVLRFFDDLDVATTAAALDISTGTVKSQTARGLDRLRDLLRAPLRVGPGDEDS